jgi:hypothetical protein
MLHTTLAPSGPAELLGGKPRTGFRVIQKFAMVGMHFPLEIRCVGERLGMVNYYVA